MMRFVERVRILRLHIKASARIILLVIAAVQFVAVAQLHATNMTTEQSLYLKLKFSGAPVETVELLKIPTRKAAVLVGRFEVNRNSEETDWIKVPLDVEGKSGKSIYHALVANYFKGGERVPQVNVSAWISNHPDGKSQISLSEQKINGGTATVVADESGKIYWFKDHLINLKNALSRAGYSDAPVASSNRIEFELDLVRFGDELLTRDPDDFYLIHDMIKCLGFNSKPQGMIYLINDEVKKVKTHKYFRGDLYAPVDDNYREKALQFWRTVQSGFKKSSIAPTAIVLGDEISLIKSQQYMASTHFNAIFNQIKNRLLFPSDIYNSQQISALQPCEIKDPTNKNNFSPIERLQIYLTMRAANIATAETFKINTEVVHEVFGADVKTYINNLPFNYGGGFASLQTWRTPDQLLLARQGAADIIENQGMFPLYPPSGSISSVLIAPAFTAQLKELNQSQNAALMMFACRTEPQAFAHAVSSAIANGLTKLNFFRIAFKASGWEWADIPEKFIELAKVNRIFLAQSEVMAGLSRKPADVAMLSAESSDLWHNNPQSYSKSELRGAFIGVKFAGYRIDYIREHMVEDNFLDRYKVLFVAQRNVNRLSQGKIFEWVKKGGVLILSPGAMLRDEADLPVNPLAEQAKLKIVWNDDLKRTDNLSEFAKSVNAKTVRFGDVIFNTSGWTEPIEGEGEVIMTYSDGKSAAQKMTFGKGSIYVLGFMPGATLCADAAIAKQDFKDLTLLQGEDTASGAVRVGVPFWTRVSPQAQNMFRLLLASSGAKPQINLNVDNIDAGVMENGEKCLVVLANYNANPVKKLKVAVPLNQQYCKAKDINGNVLKISLNMQGEIEFETELNDLQIIAFSNK